MIELHQVLAALTDPTTTAIAQILYSAAGSVLHEFTKKFFAKCKEALSSEEQGVESEFDLYIHHFNRIVLSVKTRLEKKYDIATVSLVNDWIISLENIDIPTQLKDSKDVERGLKELVSHYVHNFLLWVRTRELDSVVNENATKYLAELLTFTTHATPLHFEELEAQAVLIDEIRRNDPILDSLMNKLRDLNSVSARMEDKIDHLLESTTVLASLESQVAELNDKLNRATATEQEAKVLMIENRLLRLNHLISQKRTSDLLNSEGLSLLADGKAADAISRFKKSIDASPTWANYMNLATALGTEGQLEESIECFNTAIRFAGSAGVDTWSLRIIKALILTKLSRFEASLEELLIVESLFHKKRTEPPYQVQMNIAAVLGNLNRYKESARRLKSALKLVGDNHFDEATICLQLAWLYKVYLNELETGNMYMIQALAICREHQVRPHTSFKRLFRNVYPEFESEYKEILYELPPKAQAIPKGAFQSGDGSWIHFFGF
jgi:tetratricopeptide (TPR) repeat protein